MGGTESQRYRKENLCVFSAPSRLCARSFLFGCRASGLGNEAAKFLAGTFICGLTAILMGCGNQQKLTAHGGLTNVQNAADSLSIVYQMELKRNWSFGLENYKNRRYQEVPHFFWRVVEIDSAKSLVDVYSFLANAYAQLAKPDSALLVYQMGIQALPQNAALYRGVAALLAAQEKKMDAIAQYQQVIALNAADEHDYRRLGELYLATGDTAKAIAALEQAEAMAPGDREIRGKRSSLNPAGRNHTLVDLHSLELKQRQNPKDPPTLLTLGREYFHRREFAKCAEMLEVYVALVPDDLYACEFLGGAYLESKKYHEAMVQFNLILAEDPKQVEALTLMARCHKELKDWSSARRYAHRALAEDDQAGWAYLTLGEIYEEAARHCLESGSAVNEFSHKLVFKLAYEQYEKALLDPAWRSAARRRMTALEPMLPDARDYFVNKNQDRPDGDCYRWIYQ